MRGQWLRAVALGSLLLVTVGCTGAPTGTNSGGSLASIGGDPTARPDPTDGVPLKPEPEPVVYAPAEFWGLLGTSAGNNSGAGSLNDAVAQSEAVIAGRVTSLERGAGYDNGDSVGWFAVATLEVDSLLHGNDLASGGTVKVPFLVAMGVPGSSYPDAEFENLRRLVPDEQAVLFLVSWATVWDRTETNVPDWLAELDRYDLYRTIGAEGGFAVERGHVVAQQVSDAAYPKWAREITGLSIDELKERIESTL